MMLVHRTQKTEIQTDVIACLDGLINQLQNFLHHHKSAFEFCQVFVNYLEIQKHSTPDFAARKTHPWI
jgi:hypothetical protein